MTPRAVGLVSSLVLIGSGALAQEADDAKRPVSAYSACKSVTAIPPYLGTGIEIGGINSRGQIVGTTSTDAGELGFLQTSAFVWQDGAMRLLSGLRAGDTSFGAAINARGEVAGTISSEDGTHPVVWNRKGVPQLLATADEGYTQANAINDFGEVIGTRDLTDCVYWASPTATPTLFGLGGGNCRVHGINNDGQAFGDDFDAQGRTTAFVFQDGVTTPVVVTNERGTVLDYVDSRLLFVSDSGIAVGTFQKLGGDPRPLVWSADDAPELLPGRYRAYGVSPSGTIALFIAPNYTLPGARLFLRDERGRVRDQGTIGERGPLTFAINDRNQIAWSIVENEGLEAHAFTCKLR